MFVNLKKFKEKISDFLDSYSNLKEQAKQKIIEQAKLDLEGYKKKQYVDEFFINALIELKSNISCRLLALIIDYLITNVPSITQKIYDNLKDYIDGITKENAQNGEE